MTAPNAGFEYLITCLLIEQNTQLLAYIAFISAPEFRTNPHAG